MNAVVVDASALVELLLQRGRTRAVRAAPERARTLHAPHLVDVEVLHALRGLQLRGFLDHDRAALAVAAFSDLPIERYAHAPFTPRIWALRHAVTSYDAAYLALAEVLDAPLLTCDARLERSHGHGARVIVAR